MKLSVAGLSVAISYVFFALLGYFAFHEQIPGTRVVGLAFIVFGVVLVMWQR